MWYGHNKELMEKCGRLGEYSEFVNVLRCFADGRKDRKAALSEAVDYCIENGILEEEKKKKAVACFWYDIGRI